MALLLSQKLSLAARWLVVATSLTAFIGCTKLSGYASTDFCFLATFVVVIYSTLQAYSMSFTKVLALSRNAQLVMDVLCALLMLASGIILYLTGVPYYYAHDEWNLAKIVSYVAAFFQGLVVLCHCIVAAPDASDDIQADSYGVGNTPTSFAPVKQV
ncbi:unnamed protein product [Aphanomyces euteiches]|uniref:MARVEL domain-containing protein n=1 Tax=Aphanomyces euteiches TaxID=100861 RepID=A0A6G0XJ67_9STRA|nr:hypothetical protein Ae201684_004092 [Aphanomyces euteiches]KAH9093750.1 hypothetical protein Ae201684P_016372 [Aphanomyces euteiches]KAH9140258.1 hypothetical protein AeRB84_015489 [Aphanomyces euteiches]